MHSFNSGYQTCPPRHLHMGGFYCSTCEVSFPSGAETGYMHKLCQITEQDASDAQRGRKCNSAYLSMTFTLET